MVFKAKHIIDLVDEAYHAFDFIGDLIRRHVDMGVVLCEATNPHEAVERTGFFVAVYQAELSHAQRQITVGTRLGFVNQHTARTVHGLDCKFRIVNGCCIHVFLVMIPMAGSLPQRAV